MNGGISVNGGNITITNNWVVGSSGVSSSEVTLSNNLFDGANQPNDDPFVINGNSTALLSNIKFVNNIFQNDSDTGVEGFGGITQCIFQNNRFNRLGHAAIGGWYGNTGGSSFVMTYCTFQGNIADAATMPYLFAFNGGGNTTANDDATATALWGGNGSDGNIVNNNTFSGNLLQ